MIVRTWSARATTLGAQSYHRYFESTLLPQLHRLRGFEGAFLLEREQGSLIELTSHTLWASLDAIHDFAGDDIDAAVVEPEALAMLSDSDSTVVHRTVLLRDGR